MLGSITRAWWMVALRGAMTLVFGLAACLMPHDSKSTLRMLFGIFAIVDGAIALTTALRFARAGTAWRSLTAEAAVGAFCGAIALLLPSLSKPALAAFIAVWAIVRGGLTIVSAVRLRHLIRDEWLWLSSGIASIVFGAIVAMFPLLSLAAWLTMIAVYGSIAGLALLGLSLLLRRLRKVSL